MSDREDINAVNTYVLSLTNVPLNVQPQIDSWKNWYSNLVIMTDEDWREAQRRRDSINIALKAAQPAPATPATPGVTPSKKPVGDGFNVNPVTATKLLQKVLSIIPEDGVFGPVTDGKVKEFQKAHNLKVDGIVGPITWKALGYTSPMPQIKLIESKAAPTAAAAKAVNKPGTISAKKPGIAKADIVPTGFWGYLKGLPLWIKLTGGAALILGGYKTYEINKKKRQMPRRPF